MWYAQDSRAIHTDHVSMLPTMDQIEDVFAEPVAKKSKS
jgi:hypothetical protein